MRGKSAKICLLQEYKHNLLKYCYRYYISSGLGLSATPSFTKSTFTINLCVEEANLSKIPSYHTDSAVLKFDVPFCPARVQFLPYPIFRSLILHRTWESPLSKVLIFFYPFLLVHLYYTLHFSKSQYILYIRN